jgi:small-conductance mechanosensitive channel
LQRLSLQQVIQVTESAPSWPGALAGWEVPLSTLARALVVLLLTLVLASRIRHWFDQVSAGTNADAGTRLLVGRLLALLVLVIGAATLLDTFGIPLSAVVTFVGVVGLAVSLALQDILKNFFAGLYLLFERPFRLGDVVVVKEQRGVVETIGIRTTTLRTEENVQVLIPNMTVFAEIVANRTEFRPARVAPGDAASTRKNPEGAPELAATASPQRAASSTPSHPAGSPPDAQSVDEPLR